MFQRGWVGFQKLCVWAFGYEDGSVDCLLRVVVSFIFENLTIFVQLLFTTHQVRQQSYCVQLLKYLFLASLLLQTLKQEQKVASLIFSEPQPSAGYPLSFMWCGSAPIWFTMDWSSTSATWVATSTSTASFQVGKKGNTVYWRCKYYWKLILFIILLFLLKTVSVDR